MYIFFIEISESRYCNDDRIVAEKNLFEIREKS